MNMSTSFNETIVTSWRYEWNDMRWTQLLRSQNKEEQIVVTREKSQWIVVQDYSHTYNTRIQLSRLQRIYRNSIATYDQFKIFNDNEPVKSGEPISFHVDAVTVGSNA